MFFRWGTIVISLVIIALIGTACGTFNSAAPIEITFYKRGYTEGGEDITSVTIAQAVQAFQAANPNIKVNVVGVSWAPEGTALLEQALAERTGINVFSVGSSDLIRLSRAGILSELDPYLTPEDRRDFYASGLDAARADGKVYAWPVWVPAVSVIAHPDLFAERGVALPSLEDPWNYDEFVAAGKALTFTRSDGTVVYGFSVPAATGNVAYLPLLYIDGGRVLSPDGRRFVQNDPDGVSALQKLADLSLKHHITPPDFGLTDQPTVLEQFKTGQIAMMMVTPSIVSELEKSSMPLAVLPPPTGDLGQVVTTGAFGMYGVVKVEDEAVLAASHEFARYITGSQVAVDVPGYQQAPGLRRSNTAYATTPNREVVARLVSFGVYEAPVATSTDLRVQWEMAMQDVLTGKQTAQEALDGIAATYQAELDAQFP